MRHYVMKQSKVFIFLILGLFAAHNAFSRTIVEIFPERHSPTCKRVKHDHMAFALDHENYYVAVDGFIWEKNRRLKDTFIVNAEFFELRDQIINDDTKSIIGLEDPKILALGGLAKVIFFMTGQSQSLENEIKTMANLDEIPNNLIMPLSDPMTSDFQKLLHSQWELIQSTFLEGKDPTTVEFYNKNFSDKLNQYSSENYSFEEGQYPNGQKFTGINLKKALDDAKREITFLKTKMEEFLTILAQSKKTYPKNMNPYFDMVKSMHPTYSHALFNQYPNEAENYIKYTILWRNYHWANIVKHLLSEINTHDDTSDEVTYIQLMIGESHSIGFKDLLLDTISTLSADDIFVHPVCK
ncbi:MAG TPA: hypothetical protein PKC21_07660 [Oligoflexia bacterium]|nr:hypothetical protein [Oligoflexia bacterium]